MTGVDGARRDRNAWTEGPQHRPRKKLANAHWLDNGDAAPGLHERARRDRAVRPDHDLVVEIRLLERGAEELVQRLVAHVGYNRVLIEVSRSDHRLVRQRMV